MSIGCVPIKTYEKLYLDEGAKIAAVKYLHMMNNCKIIITNDAYAVPLTENIKLINKFLDGSDFIIQNQEQNTIYDNIYTFFYDILKSKNVINKIQMPIIIDQNEKYIHGKDNITKLKIAKIKLNNNHNIIVTFDENIPHGKIAASNKLFQNENTLLNYIFTCNKGTYADHTTYLVDDFFMKNYLAQHCSFDCVNYRLVGSYNSNNLSRDDFLYSENNMGSLFYSSDPNLEWMPYYQYRYSNNTDHIVKTFDAEAVVFDNSSHMIIIKNIMGEFTTDYKNYINQLVPMIVSTDMRNIVLTPYKYYVYNQSDELFVKKLELLCRVFNVDLTENFFTVPIAAKNIDQYCMQRKKEITLDTLTDGIGLDILLTKLLNKNQAISISEEFITTYYNSHHDLFVTLVFADKNISNSNNNKVLITVPNTNDITSIIDYLVFDMKNIIKNCVKNSSYTESNRKIIYSVLYYLCKKFSYKMSNLLIKMYGDEPIEQYKINYTDDDISNIIIDTYINEIFKINKKILILNEYDTSAKKFTLSKINTKMINAITDNKLEKKAMIKSFPQYLDLLTISNKLKNIQKFSIEQIIDTISSISTDELSTKLSTKTKMNITIIFNTSIESNIFKLSKI